MSTASLPTYSSPASVSFDRAPSYTTEPQFAMINVRSYLPSGVFLKESKGGGVILRLDYQKENVGVPVYGLGSHVEGTVELSKTDPVESVEVKVSLNLKLGRILRFTLLLSSRVGCYCERLQGVDPLL